MEAYSSPMIPAPTTINSRGNSCNSCTWSESKMRLPSIGMSASCAGRVPQAMTKLSAAQHGEAIIAGDFYAVRIDETRIALKDRHAVAAQLRLNDLDLARP